jgi:hypothetical protein
MACKGPTTSTARVSWYCTFDDATASYAATIAGTTSSRIYSVQATALVFTGNVDVGAVDYLAYVATVPYKGANQRKAQAWVRANIGKPHAITRIGVATFELWGKARSRILQIRA